MYRYVGNSVLVMNDPDGLLAPLVVIGLGILGGIAFDYVVDKIKNRNVDDDYRPDASTAGNAAAGAGTASTLPTQDKPRTGVSGGGRSGNRTSVASKVNHNLVKNKATQRTVTKFLRKVPYIGTAICAAELGDAIVNPTQTDE